MQRDCLATESEDVKTTSLGDHSGASSLAETYNEDCKQC